MGHQLAIKMPNFSSIRWSEQ